jgi:hypothetical protein
VSLSALLLVQVRPVRGLRPLCGTATSTVPLDEAAFKHYSDQLKGKTAREWERGRLVRAKQTEKEEADGAVVPDERDRLAQRGRQLLINTIWI